MTSRYHVRTLLRIIVSPQRSQTVLGLISLALIPHGIALTGTTSAVKRRMEMMSRAWQGYEDFKSHSSLPLN